MPLLLPTMGFGTKSLSKPMLAHYHYDTSEQILMKFVSQYNNFHTRKLAWKYRLQNGGHLSRPQSFNYLENVYVAQTISFKIADEMHNTHSVRSFIWRSAHLKYKSQLSITCYQLSNHLKILHRALPRCVQNFNMIGRLKRMLWMNEILWDLSLRWVSEWYPICW